MNTYTTIGYFVKAADEPILFVVKARNTAGAIRAAERMAKAIHAGLFINTFILAGAAEVLSTWAG